MPISPLPASNSPPIHLSLVRPFLAQKCIFFQLCVSFSAAYGPRTTHTRLPRVRVINPISCFAARFLARGTGCSGGRRLPYRWRGGCGRRGVSGTGRRRAMHLMSICDSLTDGPSTPRTSALSLSTPSLTPATLTADLTPILGLQS